jgi:hypothetical protein
MTAGQLTSITDQVATAPAIQAEGHKTLGEIAHELAARKVETRCGGAWTAVQVTDLLKRLDRVSA